MKITPRAQDVYEVSVCDRLRPIVVTGARMVVQRTGRLGTFVQRLVGFIDATRIRFETTIRRLADHEVQRLVRSLPMEMGIAERLLGQAMRRLGTRQTLSLLRSTAPRAVADLVTTPAVLPAGG